MDVGRGLIILIAQDKENKNSKVNSTQKDPGILKE